MGWAAYNARLVARGNPFVFIDAELLSPEVWYGVKNGQARRPDTYSDAAIRACASLGAAFGQPLRQTEGFVRGMFEHAGIGLDVPDYSTIARRRRRLKLKLPKSLREQPAGRCIAIDSTGFMTYEPSAWREKQHRETLSKRRWVKLHLMIDTDTMEILAVRVTDEEGYGSGDSLNVKPLLEQCPDPLIEARADGAYDAFGVRRRFHERGARSVIPPRSNAVAARHKRPNRKHPPWTVERDNDLVAIRELGRKLQAQHPDKTAWEVGLGAWKKAAGYGQRSHVESVIGALKTTLGARLRATTKDGAVAELTLRCEAYNRLLLAGAASG